MVYVFDTSSFIVIGHYYPERFPTFWSRFDAAVDSEEIISVREAFNELTTEASRPWLSQWIKEHKDMFLVPSDDETQFVRKIFNVPHFQMLVNGKARLTGETSGGSVHNRGCESARRNRRV